ncbi:MAG: hypothetical protein C3F11_03050 [Methylocystaceae bacterium]|nr:MAG: hypothetical protein C3F11_03050 [Methylocystaceae bacterium]
MRRRFDDIAVSIHETGPHDERFPDGLFEQAVFRRDGSLSAIDLKTIRSVLKISKRAAACGQRSCHV